MDSRQYTTGGGDYLKADDIKDKGSVPVTIASVSVASLGDEGDKKLCLAFQGTDKVLTLNKTNGRVLEDAYGYETDAWVGKKITLQYDANVRFQGKRVGGIAVHVEGASKPTEQPAAPAGDYQPDDDVPF